MYNDKIEVIRENGNKRVVKRTICLKRFNRKGNFKQNVDYCLQEKITEFEDRWRIIYFNKSKTLVERRFLGL